MDVREKVIKALSDSMNVEFARIDDDDGITGFVVSPRFRDMSAMDRQILIEEALKHSPDPLTREERRHVLMIAGLTPDEYETVGARVRIHKVETLPGGTVEILLRGGPSDARYVKAALDAQGAIKTEEPRKVAGAEFLMSLRAKGTEEAGLTKAKVIEMLEIDRYVEILANARL